MSIEDRYLSGLIAVQYPDAPVEDVQLAAGPSDTVSDAGTGVRVGRAGVPYKPPSMRDITEPAGAMLDMGAATVKGAVQGFAGLPGDLEGIGRMVLGAMGVQAGEKTVLPTTDEVKAWLDTNVGKVGNGQNPYESFGEVTAPGGQIKAVKAAGFDGFYVKEGKKKNLAVYDPTQIKSVFNKGTWNPEDPRILHGAGAGTAGTAATMQDKEKN